MKPLHYVRELKLDSSMNKQQIDKLIEMLGNEFRQVCLDSNIDGNDYVKFQNVVNQFHQKWVGISNKSKYGLSDGLWSFFYASKICVVRDELYPKFKKIESGMKKAKAEEAESEGAEAEKSEEAFNGPLSL